MNYYKDKIVWITGASSGIGEAMAYAFAQAGARLILSARRTEELQRVLDNCKIAPDRALLLPLDVSDLEAVKSQSQIALAHFGGIDILVNNAGLSHWAKVKDLDFEVIQRIMNVNFFGAVALTKAVLPTMLEQKSGNIVVISSILGKIVSPKQAAYNASKHALQGFFDTLRAEVSGDGLAVLLVCPGFVKTNVAKNSLDRHGKPLNKENQLINTGFEPAYVAQKVLKAIENKSTEIILAAPKERLGLWIKRFFPRLFTRFISKRKAT